MSPSRRAPEAAAFAVSAGDRLAQMFATEPSAGTLPGVRTIKGQARVGTPKAQEILEHLEGVLTGQSLSGQ